MPKNKISEFDVDPANNTDINSINIAEGCAPSGINNAIRQLMSDLKEFQTGAGGDPFNGAVNGTVGATTANTGSFTTLSATGVTTVSAGSVSAPAITTSGDTNTGIFFPAADTIAFAEGGVESMRIDSSGNVGIGTSSPWSQVSIGTPSGGTVGYFGVKDTVQGGDIRFGKQSGINNDGIVGVWSNNNFLFYTSSTERMRIDSSGNLLVGTTSQIGGARFSILSNDSIATRGVTGSIAGTWKMYRADNGVKAWSIETDGNNFYVVDDNFSNYAYLNQNPTSWLFASDSRIKTNIQDLTYGLDAVMAIRPRSFDYIATNKHDIGFIAQELKEVIPEAVSGEELPFDDADTQQERAKKILGVGKETLIPVLVKAIQELNAKFEEYKASHP